MTQEEYNQLDYDYAHCAGANCQKAGQCLHHTVYTMLQTNKHDYYTVVNPNVTTGKQPCPIYEADRKERFTWGISRIYDNVRTSDLRGVKITEEEQQDIRSAFTEMGYDGNAIEFDHYEEQYPAVMRIAKY